MMFRLKGRFQERFEKHLMEPFLYTCTQVGAEKVLKAEILGLFPALRFAFSRPGFLTFKITGLQEREDVWNLSRQVRERSVFARCAGISLGKVSADSPEMLAKAMGAFPDSPLCPREKIRRLHFWSRDSQIVGENGFEPIPSQQDLDEFQRLLQSLPTNPRIGKSAQRSGIPARKGEMVLDCIRIDPNSYWLGFHWVSDLHSAFPGGCILTEIPDDMISRAWLKFEEALRWSGFPISPGTRCVDIGSSPGGASQVLLNRGAEVLAVDPAEMDSRLIAYPNFTHLRGKIGQLKKKSFRKIKYAIADMNVAPSFTLDVLEDFVLHREIPLRGLLFTLKLFQWKLAENIPEFLRRIRGWGFKNVQARQLTFNRQEITIAACKNQ